MLIKQIHIGIDSGFLTDSLYSSKDSINQTTKCPPEKKYCCFVFFVLQGEYAFHSIFPSGILSKIKAFLFDIFFEFLETDSFHESRCPFFFLCMFLIERYALVDQQNCLIIRQIGGDNVADPGFIS